MTPSSRITSIAGNGPDGWEIYHKAQKMAKSGIAITQLTIGEHDIKTDPAILESMHQSAKHGNTGYSDIPGIPELRQAIADRIERQTSVPTNLENVLVTPGGQAALFAAHMAACDPGDVGIYCDPYYATYPSTIRAAGARPKAIQTCPENKFQPSREKIEQALEPGCKSLLINTPNNPTGTVYDKSTIQGVAQAVQEHDLWAISDEVYDTLVWEGQHTSPRSLPGMPERTIVVGSMSKSFAMTGSRIGWIVAPENLIEPLADLALSTTYGIPGFIQDAALFALNNGDILESQIAEPFARRRKIAFDCLSKASGMKLIPNQGAMYQMVDIRPTGLSGIDFASKLLDQEKIAVMPGESFGQAAAGHIRIAMTVDDTAFAEALSKIVKFVERLEYKAS